MSRRLLVEADGGSRGNPGPAAYGSLVRDPGTGRLLATRAEHIGIASNNVAEYGGLVAGLKLAIDLDPDAEIEVRMDSKLVVEQMSGRWQIKHADMRRLAAQAREVVGPRRVRYTWIPREKNVDADRLANEALDDAAKGRPWRGSTVGAGAAAAEPLPGPDQQAPSEQPPSRRGPADLGAATTLTLLRHGVTALTLERRFSGRGGADLPLEPEGVAQAQAAARAIEAAGGADVLIASPLLRTRQTASLVAQRLSLDVRVDEGFVEMAFGDWDGLTTAEVAERWPAELDAWHRSTAVAPPGGSSLDDLEGQVSLARDKVLARHPRARVVVVTHSTPIRQLVRLALGAGTTALWRLESTPAALTTLRCWSDGGTAVSSYNQTGHLTGPLRP